MAGYATAGKDTAALTLIDEFGFERRAFADKIRVMLKELNPIVGFDEDMDHVSLADAVDIYAEGDWGQAKVGRWGEELRRLMQRFGTEVMRSHVDDDIWADLCLPTTTLQAQGFAKETVLADRGRVVITDVRFRNEVARVRTRALDGTIGQVWWVHRNGVGPVNDHPSDNSLTPEDCDRVILNDGSLEDLQSAVRRAAESVFVEP